jgi:acyl dehydratase
MAASQPRGMYFEDFELEQQIITVGRTVTETDVVQYAGLSGDYNQIHTDAEYSKDIAFGRRVAHGLLVVSIVSGLAFQTGVMEGTVIAFREIGSWKFSRPVFIGDTVHAVLEVVNLKKLPRLGGGSVDIKISVINQEGKTVMSGVWTVLMLSRPA